MAWQYFNDTGIVGGTTNPTDQTFYIDSYNGDDANVGSNVAPFKTIQKALDEASYTPGSVLELGADLIVAGYFKEGNFSNQRNKMSIIAEGQVVIDGSLHTHFQLGLISNAWRATSLNYNQYNTKARRRYGSLTFRNYNDGVMFGHNNNGGGSYDSSIYDCTFDNCARVGGENVYEGEGTTGSAYIVNVKDCVFKNIYTFVAITNRSVGIETTFAHNNTFINCALVKCLGGNNTSVQSSYFDTATKIKLTTTLLNVGKFDHSHVEGSLASKIDISASLYNDNELAQAAYPDFNPNGRLSTDANEFNALVNDDYTYPNTAVNATGGYLGSYIGAFGIADGAQNVDDANWARSNITITGTGSSSVATLTASGTGTLTTTNGIQVATEDKYLGRLSLPSVVNDYTNGETVDTNLSSAGTPQVLTVEIQYSTDNVSYSAWTVVPYDAIPMVDGAGVGNGDPAYNPATGTRIILQYLKYRITLRDNEVPVP